MPSIEIPTNTPFDLQEKILNHVRQLGFELTFHDFDETDLPEEQDYDNLNVFEHVWALVSYRQRVGTMIENLINTLPAEKLADVLRPLKTDCSFAEIDYLVDVYLGGW